MSKMHWFSWSLSDV